MEAKMLNISSEQKIVLTKKEYDDMELELKKLRAKDKLSQELQKGFLSVLSGKVVSSDSALKRLVFSKYES